jgi:hypothetical protein
MQEQTLIHGKIDFFCSHCAWTELGQLSEGIFVNLIGLEQIGLGQLDWSFYELIDELGLEKEEGIGKVSIHQ